MTDEPLEPEAMLEALLTGQLADTDPTVQKALADSPELRERLERLRALEQSLDRAGAEARDELEDELRSRDNWPPEIRNREPLSRRDRRFSGFAAAAAALVAIGLLWWFWPESAPADNGSGIYLGVAETMSPQDEYTLDQVFSWDPIDLPPGGELWLHFYDVEVFGTGNPFLRARVDAAHEWTANASERESFLDPMIWALVVIDATGARDVRGYRRVTRKP